MFQILLLTQASTSFMHAACGPGVLDMVWHRVGVLWVKLQNYLWKWYLSTFVKRPLSFWKQLSGAFKCKRPTCSELHLIFCQVTFFFILVMCTGHIEGIAWSENALIVRTAPFHLDTGFPNVKYLVHFYIAFFLFSSRSLPLREDLCRESNIVTWRARVEGDTATTSQTQLSRVFAPKLARSTRFISVIIQEFMNIFAYLNSRYEPMGMKTKCPCSSP